jgi:uncharacterized protein (TIGR02145 family)
MGILSAHFFLAVALMGFQISDNAADIDHGEFIDPRDNHVYKTIKIGDQVWLAENFAYLPEICAPDSADCGVWVYNYEGTDLIEARSTVAYQKYGALYNWEKAISLAPEGWHLPSDEEWKTLEGHIGIGEPEISSAVWRGDNSKVSTLKAGGLGLNVVFGGWRTDYGKWNYIGQHANFWCATEFDKGRAYERLLGLNNGKIGRDKGNKGCGFSVRYIKD